ncbi:YecA family protein [Syntrophus buswellii]|uniref:YecA family protein n=1 Tax=Syntrophus buswellii TaxID=43774 RepID=UPI0038D40154
MNKIGRNDLCPCGSGKKYKKCCLAKDDQFASRRRDEERAIQTALSWLEEHYPEEASEAVRIDFMDGPDEGKLDAIDDLSPRLAQALSINIGEWLLADAVLDVNGKDIKAHELILGKGGPLLTSRGREWIRELAKHPLSLYEVKEVIKDQGLVLTDMLHPDQPPVRVRERAATGFLVPWDTLGTRLMWQDDSFVMSGATYLMERETALDCLAEIKSEREHESGDPAIDRYITASIIINCWLDSILEIRTLPELVDMSTGDKILLTTDHYRVADWKEVERILEAQEDVDGDRDEGWNRFEELEDGRCRSRASMVPKGPDTLEVFCRTTKLADEARQWLEEIAGSVITYKIREVVDPRSEKALDAAKLAPEPDIPQEIQRQLIHQYLAKHYETWPEIALPALKGKSPLEAVKDKKLRPLVVELLKAIDQLEARRIDQTGGEPFDVTFLWERLGLRRE